MKTKIDGVIAFTTLPVPFTTLGVTFLTFSGMYMPELYIFIWFFIFILFNKSRFNILKKIIFDKVFIFIIAGITSVSIFSLARSDFDLLNFYARYRSLFFCSAALSTTIICYRMGWGEKLESYLIIFCSSASLMYLISNALTASGDNSKASTSMICFSIAICLFVERGSFHGAIIIASMSGIAAFLSFFRQNYITAAHLILTTLMVSFICILFINGKFKVSRHIFSIFPSTILIIFILIYFSDNALDFLASSESRYSQSIAKTEDLYESIYSGKIDESGGSRINDYVYLLNNIYYYLLPNGLIDDSTLSLYSIWGGNIYSPGISVVRDSALSFLIVTFGFLILLVLLIIYSYVFIFSIRNSHKNLIYRILFIAPTMFSVLLVDGLTLTQINKSVFFGLGLALLIPCKIFFKSNMHS